MRTIDIETARCFILGKQGVWPGRRWRGNDGTAAAMAAMEYLQLDPLQIIARSQDIALQSRVTDYTLPILWGDRLVARIDSRFDRATGTYVLLGFWLEEKGLADDTAFAEALAGGFLRFAKFLGATKLDAGAINEPLLRQCVVARRLHIQ